MNANAIATWIRRLTRRSDTAPEGLYGEVALARRCAFHTIPQPRRIDGLIGMTSQVEHAAAMRSRREFAETAASCTPFWRHVLDEAHASVAASPDLDALRRQLIGLAAVCLEWVDDIDRPEHLDINTYARTLEGQRS